MSTITLESIQNELIREILDIKNVKVLESVRKTLVHHLERVNPSCFVEVKPIDSAEEAHIHLWQLDVACLW